MNKIMELISRIFGGRGIDKKFPLLLWLFKWLFFHTQKNIPLTVVTGYGSKLVVAGKDAGLGLTLRSGKSYEPLLTSYFQKKIKKGDTFLDIGANVGYFTKLGSQLVGKKGRVIAFEPSPGNLFYLEKNTQKQANVTVVPVALGNHEGAQGFEEDLANPGENGFAQRAQNTVPVVRLVDWMKSHKLSRINLVKIDVEGAEVMVLAGAQTILKQQQRLILACECNPHALSQLGYTVADLQKSVSHCGLKITYIIDERLNQVSTYTTDQLRQSLAGSAYVTLIAERYVK